MRSLPKLGWCYSAVAVIGVLSLVGAPLTRAQQIHRNAFENPRPIWTKGAADVTFQEIEHTITDQGAHDGQNSEYIKLNAEQGSHIYYQYPTGKALISAELNASIWLKSNRHGIQLLARVVLPKERDPSNLDAPLTTLLRGEVYRLTGRWQRLELGRPLQLAQQQQQIMQAQLKRSINFSDAYVDALVVNVFGGPGPTEVWIDDLEIGPVFSEPGRIPGVVRPGVDPKGPAHEPRPTARGQVIEFNGTQLLVGGRPFFMRNIKHTDTPIPVLRDAGFNTLTFNYTADPKLVREAADLGFWLVPTLQVMANDSRLATADGVRQEMGRFAENDAVLFWHLGGTLAAEQSTAVARTVQFMKTVDPGRPLGADVWDGLRGYGRNLQLLGIHRWPLLTTLELAQYAEWLDQRRRLANDAFMFTWVQTHLPDWYTYLLYNQSGGAAFKDPIGPQPEQVRLLAYTAIGSGCRGLSFWSDRFLSDSHSGRDRLLCLALLNQELEMIEPLLVTATSRQWIDTSSKDVKAAVIRGPKGVLVLPIWLGKGSQFVPGQSAVPRLTINVPQVPQSHQAWEVSPGDTRGLRSERVTGGSKITLPEFGLTSAIVFTSDTSVIVRFQEQARSRRQHAAQWTYDMALYEMEKVLRIEQKLENQGHVLPDGKHLIEDSQARLRTAKQHWDNRLFAEAYRESQRALRPLRILMRAQWELATKALDSPVSSPYAVSFFTLPKHWEFMDQVSKSIATGNVLPGGDFEIIPERVQDSWRPEEPTLDDVEMTVERVSEVSTPQSAKPGAAPPPAVAELPRQGKQCLRLQIRPKNKELPPQALERTLLALTSPVVHLQPGSLVQVSAWVRIPKRIEASPDGALFYDSAGGEPLALRLTEPMPWKKISLYRRVPDSGTLHVTLALTGLGSAYFDDVRIEPLVPSNRTASAP
ncbi:MAG: hypothetical protein FJ271_13940 [Planctomycetes bacterium]|nr:hypothetical protein [Planctomycetota bacterium]